MKRYVTQTRKNWDGDIIALCNPTASWSPRGKQDVITDIENRFHTYVVPWTNGETTIRVVNGSTGKYLRTDRDNTSRNNLDDLPNC
ncbi:MAG: DUF3892 domain-containing protein [Chloroflexi bacterium]|nr:DUF3892 domain-containing protein [Chloroflexota bacterium]